jgi:inorganic pyrophosphatase
MAWQIDNDQGMNLLTIPTFLDENTFHVVVESPRGSNVKLKYEPRWECMSISRPLTLGLTFPFDWGFVPSTRAADGDPIDTFVVWDVGAFPGVVLPCRSLGVLRLEQNRSNFDRSIRVRNDRILALPTLARRQGELTALNHIPQRIREECVQFTVAAAALEGKDVEVLGWGDASEGMAVLASHTVRE